MKLSEFIQKLEDIKQTHGDINCGDASDNEVEPEVVDGYLVIADRA